MIGTILLASVLSVSASPESSSSIPISTIRDGTLIYLENSNKIVQSTTDAEITHVAMIFEDESQHWVYEATPARVRRLTLQQYVREIGMLNADRDEPMTMWIMQPQESYPETEARRMQQFLKKQIGRRYSIQSYVRGQRREGIHCAELAGDTLDRAQRYEFQRTYKRTPAAVIAAVQSDYSPARRVRIQSQERPGNWCQRTWGRWYDAWDWCKWSCYETWTFCF